MGVPTVATTLLIILSGILVWLAFMAHRNNQVAKYRQELIRVASLRCYEDICAHRPWRWRFDEYEKVSYNKMMVEFWKPLDSFYENKDFLK